MGRVLCEFNSVNGQNTGVNTRKGTSSSYPSAGILIKKNCPNGQFYIESTDGGPNNYYRLLDPQNYTGIDSSSPVYVWISSSYLKYPKPSEVQTLGRTSYNTTSSSQPTTGTSGTITNTLPSSSITSTTNNVSSYNYSTGLDSTIQSYLQSTKIKDLVGQNTTRVFGAPFQFTNIVDHRAYSDNKDRGYGRKYLENIAAEAPILYITPGLPDYMPDSDKNVKETIDNYISAKLSGSDVSSDAQSSVMNIEGRYYGFISAYSEYIRYVNLLCRVCAYYMDPGDGSLIKNYGKYNWGKWTNIDYDNIAQNQDTDTTGIFNKIGNAFQDVVETAKDKIADEIFGEYKYVKCYVLPNISYSESNSNGTTSSQVAGLFDSLESIVKEIGFFSNGSGIMSGVTDTLTSGLSSAANGITGTLDSNVSAGLSKIIGNATHVITGSNVIFPELWSDSQFSKSYNFTIDLVSPYGDTESCYLNIIVPLMHILAFSMPRQTTANSFGSPFLIKIFAKGWFSCDLGIVDSISIEKSEESWTVQGFPNEVKINLSVKDLYQNLSISKSSTPGLFFANQGLIEFLAVTCGLNITEANLGLKINTIISAFTNSILDIPTNIYNNIIESMRNAIEPWFKITR